MTPDQVAELLEPSDVREAAYGTRIPSGQHVDKSITRLIEKAARLIVDKVPNLEQRLDSGKLRVSTLKDVLEDMVVRVVKNPGGYRQIGIDDFQATIDHALSSGALRLDRAERRRLSGARSTSFGTFRTPIPHWRLPRV